MKTKLSRNNTNFLYEVFTWMKTIEPETPYDFLTYYQYLTYKFVSLFDIDTRGLLLYHTMGMGKTLLAVAIAWFLSQQSDIKYDPIILSSLTLQSNFIKDIKLYIRLRTKSDPSFKLGTMPDDELDKWIHRNFKFVTMKASNMMAQLSTAATDSAEMDYDKKLKQIVNLGNLDGKVIIVDEAHNLFRAIINGSKNAINLYELIMKSKDAKVFFLSGKPIAKHPFEMVPCFNMLGGRYTDSKEFAILPEKYADFAKYFIGDDGIKNKGKFQNRIQGMVSYVSHNSTLGKNSDVWKEQSMNTDSGFPTELPLIVKRVHMDEQQYTAYILARDREKEETSRKKKFERLEVGPLSIPGQGSSSTYRIRSRQISNYYQSGIGFKTPVAEIPLEKTDSPKYRQMYKDIQKSTGITMVFSQLLHMSGLGVFARYLLKNGWKQYGGTDVDKTKPTFAFISGNLSKDERTNIQNVLNSEENKDGDIISAILISDAGAEGLDLKNIRLVLIMEPQWTDSKFNQVKHRAIRKNSHMMLKPDQRNVQVIVYLAIKPKSSSSNDKDLTTDVVIWDNSKLMNKLNRSFELALQEVSIECYVNGDVNCRMCNPSRETLFDWNIKRDMASRDPCESMEKVEKQVKAIKVNDIDYYWEPNDKSIFKYSIYYYDEMVGAHRRMKEDDVRFSSVIDAIQ